MDSEDYLRIKRNINLKRRLRYQIKIHGIDVYNYYMELFNNEYEVLRQLRMLVKI